MPSVPVIPVSSTDSRVNKPGMSPNMCHWWRRVCGSLSRTPEHAQAPRSSHILFYLWEFGLDQQARSGEELVPYKLGDHRAQNIVGDAGVPDAQVKPWSYHLKLTPALALVRAGNVHSQGDSCSPSDSWGPEGGQVWGHRTPSMQWMPISAL